MNHKINRLAMSGKADLATKKIGLNFVKKLSIAQYNQNKA